MRSSAQTVPAPALRANGVQTERRILDEALKLFSEHGYNATSMRMICSAAQVNLSSLYYHFGSKEGVLAGVCEFLFEPMRAERKRLLDTALAQSHGTVPDPHTILTAYVGPAIRLARHPKLGAVFNRLAGHLSTDPTPEVRGVIARIHDTSMRDFFTALRDAYPTLVANPLFVALQCTFGVMMYIQSDPGRIEALLGFRLKDADEQEAIDLVVRFAAGGLRELAVTPQTRSTTNNRRAAR